MSVGLELVGCPPVSCRDLLPQLQQYILTAHRPLCRYCSIDDERGVATLLVVLHPAAEALRFWIEDNDLRASAQTSSVGPGFHYFVCDLLREVEREFKIEWQPGGDETGYFDTGDPQAVQRSMLDWLCALCGLMLDESRSWHAQDDNMIAMPLGTVFRAGMFLVTQMGPRSKEWAISVRTDANRGKDFFPWWNAEQDGEFYLNRALCLMWNDVRWRMPIVDGEAALLAQVAGDLEQAYRLAPTLDYPWSEWHEILNWLGRAGELPEVSESCRSFIGYRRNAVRVSLPGRWTIEIPGSLAVEMDDEGTWSAWDSNMTVWVNAYSVSDTVTAKEILRNFEAPSEDMFEFGNGDILVKGAHVCTDEGGEEVWCLQARAAVTSRYAMVTIAYLSLEAREKGLAVLRSLRA